MQPPRGSPLLLTEPEPGEPATVAWLSPFPQQTQVPTWGDARHRGRLQALDPHARDVNC